MRFLIEWFFLVMALEKYTFLCDFLQKYIFLKLSISSPFYSSVIFVRIFFCGILQMYSVKHHQLGNSSIKKDTKTSILRYIYNKTVQSHLKRLSASDTCDHWSHMFWLEIIWNSFKLFPVFYKFHIWLERKFWILSICRLR